MMICPKRAPLTATCASWKVILRAWPTDTCADFDQAALNAREGPVGNVLWQVCPLEEVAVIVGQSMKLKPDLIVP